MLTITCTHDRLTYAADTDIVGSCTDCGKLCLRSCIGQENVVHDGMDAISACQWCGE